MNNIGRETLGQETMTEISGSNQAVIVSPDILKLLSDTKIGAEEQLEELGDYTKPDVIRKIEMYREEFKNNKRAKEMFDKMELIAPDELRLPSGIIVKIGYPDVQPDGKEIKLTDGAVYFKFGKKFEELRRKMLEDGWRIPGTEDLDNEYSNKNYQAKSSFVEKEFKEIFDSFPKNEKDSFYGKQHWAMMVMDILGFKGAGYYDVNGSLRKDVHNECFWGPICFKTDSGSMIYSCNFTYHFADPASISTGSADCMRGVLFFKRPEKAAKLTGDRIKISRQGITIVK